VLWRRQLIGHRPKCFGFLNVLFPATPPLHGVPTPKLIKMGAKENRMSVWENLIKKSKL
jgi:hypothetical protein